MTFHPVIILAPFREGEATIPEPTRIDGVTLQLVQRGDAKAAAYPCCIFSTHHTSVEQILDSGTGDERSKVFGGGLAEKNYCACREIHRVLIFFLTQSQTTTKL